MSIETQISQPATVTLTYKCENIVINKPTDLGKWIAEVQFGVYDQDGNRTDTVVLDYTPGEFNDFWSNFNNGTYLYNQLNTKESLGVTVGDSETDFINGVPVVV